MTHESLQSCSFSHMTTVAKSMTTGAEEGEGSDNDELSVGGERTLHATRIQTTIEKSKYIHYVTRHQVSLKSFCSLRRVQFWCRQSSSPFKYISENIIRETID